MKVVHLHVAAAGLWLGLTQVALGFALMTGAGASATIFFSLTAAWIAGGAAGVALGRPGATLPLLGAALVASAAARTVLAAAPFGAGSVALGLAAGAAAGAFAGAFLRDRSRAAGDVRRIFFHENNGFVAGYAAAGALLFVSSRALDVAAWGLGAALLIAQVVLSWSERTRR